MTIKQIGIAKSTVNMWFTIVSVAFVVITTLIGIITVIVGAGIDIEQNTNNINLLATSVEQLNEQQIVTNNRITVIETHYDHIKNQLDRIEKKLEVKQ